MNEQNDGKGWGVGRSTLSLVPGGGQEVDVYIGSRTRSHQKPLLPNPL